jgi:hypothetical protein
MYKYSNIHQEMSEVIQTTPIDFLNERSKGLDFNKVHRCPIEGCGKKLGMMPFKCRCGNEYCIKHRTSESHKCVYNYITDGRKLLEVNNQRVAHEKVIKI